MAMEPPLTLSLSSGDAELPLDDQRYAGEGLIDLEQADAIDAGAGGLQGLAGSVQDGGELRNGVRPGGRQGPEPRPRDQAAPPGEAAAGDEQGGGADLGGVRRGGTAAGREDGQPGGGNRPGQVDRGRDDSHMPKRGWHADLPLTVQSYSL
jgi:hypothetical protein